MRAKCATNSQHLVRGICAVGAVAPVTHFRRRYIPPVSVGHFGGQTAAGRLAPRDASKCKARVAIFLLRTSSSSLPLLSALGQHHQQSSLRSLFSRDLRLLHQEIQLLMLKLMLPLMVLSLRHQLVQLVSYPLPVSVYINR